MKRARLVWQPSRRTRLTCLGRRLTKKITLGWILIVALCSGVAVYVHWELAHHTLIANLKQVKPTSWVIAAFGLPLLFYVYREVTRVPFIIDKFSVPKKFQDAGLTSDVVANRIGDAVRQIKTSAQACTQSAANLERPVPHKDDLSMLRDEAALPDVEIPGTKISLRTIIEITRAVFGTHPKHLSGDIVIADGTDSEITVTINITKGRDRSPAISFKAPANDIELLALRTAEMALQQVNPRLLATYRINRKELAQAISVVQEMIKDPAQPRISRIEALILWGNILLEQRQYNDAAAKYQAVIELDPKYSIAFNNWGNVLLAKKEFDAAIEKYRQSIELDPQYAVPYHNWGLVHFQRGKRDEAAAYFETAIKLDPKFMPAYVNWAKVLRQRKRYEDAISKYKKAIEIDPKYAPAYASWGDVLRLQEKYDEAAAKIELSIKADPKFVSAYYIKGMLLHDRKRYDEAIVHYCKALELNPEHLDSHNFWALALSKQEKYHEAAVRFQQAIEIDPEYAVSYNNFGNSLRSQKRYDEAIEMYRQAIKHDEGVALFHHNVGRALLDQKKYDEAIAEFKRAIEIDHLYAKAHDGWGEALKEQGQLAQAREKFETARELAARVN